MYEFKIGDYIVTKYDLNKKQLVYKIVDSFKVESPQPITYFELKCLNADENEKGYLWMELLQEYYELAPESIMVLYGGTCVSES